MNSLALTLIYLISSLPPPSTAEPDPGTSIINLRDSALGGRDGERIPTELSGNDKEDIIDIFDAIDNIEKAVSNNKEEILNKEGELSITIQSSDFNEVGVDTKALNILDLIHAQEADINGMKCVNKTMMRRETEYKEIMTCTHSYDERCHTSYTTNYEPHQEEECEERFRKVCTISNEEKAVTEMVEECTTPLVPDCEDTGPEVCRTVYDTVCDTRQETYDVEEQFPDCSTVNMTKCEPVVTGLISEEKCVVWPTQQCTVKTHSVTHSNPKTVCRKEPRELCAPGDCAMVKVQSQSYILSIRPVSILNSVQGPVLCNDKMKTVVVANPVEECDLEPQETCKQVTKLVPQLQPRQECVQVPKEVCATSRVEPEIKLIPYIQKWCFKPDDHLPSVEPLPSTEGKIK